MDFTVAQTNEQLNLRFFSKHPANTRLTFFDVTGKKMLEMELMITEGINYHPLNCVSIATWLYKLEIEGKGIMQREKVIVR